MPPHTNQGGTDAPGGDLFDTIGPDKSAVVKGQVNDRVSAIPDPYTTRHTALPPLLHALASEPATTKEPKHP